MSVNSMTYLDNGTIKLGVDTTWGGAISYLSASGSADNLINRHDAGRLVQQSYYGAGQYPNCGWGLNPVQGGDVNNHPSGIISHHNTGSLIYVKCRPLDWCLQNVAADCIMENWYALEGNAVKVVARFTHNETVMGAIRDQELPAVFTVASINRFARYSGTAPFTNGALTTDTPGYPNEVHYQSEGWGTHLDVSGNGLGWYTPHVYYSTNYMYIGDGSLGEHGDQTAYTAPLYRFALSPASLYEFDYYIVAGTAADTRNWAYQKNCRTASGWNFIFDGDREGWSLSSHADGNGPLNGIWSMIPPSGTPFSIVSPPVTIPSSRNRVQIRLKNMTGATSLTFSWQRSGLQEANRVVFSNSVTIPIGSNGNFATYTCDMSAVPEWTGLIQSVKFTVTGTTASNFDIDWIHISSPGGSAPIVSKVQAVALCENLAAVHFDTNVDATAQVEYGSTFGYGAHTPDNINLSTSHTVYLSDLLPNQTYHYRIRTRDADGNESVGPDNSFITPTRVVSKLWSFDQTGDLEGWTMQNQVTGTVSGGSLNLTSTGNDPYIWSPDLLNIANPATNRYIRIRLKNNASSTTAQFFFITDSDTVWSSAKSVAFSITANDSAYKEYSVDMAANGAWTGTVRRIRFDPLYSAGTMNVDWIRVTN
ncbi:hypothetical protein [Paenibacillus sp. MBLB4367]|uniref:hypothetical protein n=1 Tax=Paenibacillus sp. MBLB4367 TaxID=3384767 RepID=UPI0039081C06